MITYDTQRLVEKFLSDLDYQTQTDNIHEQLAKTGLSTGLKGFDWQIGGLRPGDLFLLVGEREEINTTFLAFILHSLCWKQQVSTQVYACAKPVDRWLPYLLSAELKISISSLRWGVTDEDRERVKKAGQILTSLPLRLSELDPTCVRQSFFEMSEGKILLIDDFPLEKGGESEAFLCDLKRIALRKRKIVLVSSTLDEKICHYPDIYVNLRSFGLLSSACDFIGLLGLRVPGQDYVVDATEGAENPKIIPSGPTAMDKLTLRMLYNARLPGSSATFLYNKFDVADFRDEII